ncbi:MAG: RluA family pseudouridine synthase [Desulfomonilia bacterium]
MNQYESFVFRKTAAAGDPDRACEFFAFHTGVSRTRIREAMIKGAAWQKRIRGIRGRVRRATAQVKPGDRMELYYDERLLSAEPVEVMLLADRKEYSLWYKPAGLLTQGTQYGDHCSLLRQVEIAFRHARHVFPVHRLDREASGLVLVAHTKKAAAHLSGRFRENSVKKRYRVHVRGDLLQRGTRGSIDLPLEGKNALTSYVVDSYDAVSDESTVTVEIGTGRLHQIRRHFHHIGHPVMGDPRYGKGNKNTDGMKLIASELEFDCPVHGHRVCFRLDEYIAGQTSDTGP